MQKREMLRFREKLLERIRTLSPILPEICEVWISIGYGFDGGRSGNNLKIPSLVEMGTFIKRVRMEEERGLKNGYKVLKSFDFMVKFTTADDVKEAIVNCINKLKNEEDRFGNCVYNFGLDRIIDTIKRYPESPRNFYKDFLWENIDGSEHRLLVPGFRKKGMCMIKDETGVLYKISEFLKMLKPEDIDDTLEHQRYKLIDINKIKEIKGIEEDDGVNSFIVKKIEEFVEASFPGSNKILGRYPGVFYGVVYTKDLIFLYARLEIYADALLFPILLNTEKEDGFHILLFFIDRMLKILAGESEDFTPGVVWVKEDFIQKTLPQDARCVFQSSNSDVEIFLSQDTGTFIHISKEGEPYFRIIFYPFEFFQDILTSENPILEIERNSYEQKVSY